MSSVVRVPLTLTVSEGGPPDCEARASSSTSCKPELAGKVTVSMAVTPLLEAVMNSSSGAVACWYGEQKTIPKRRFRRRVVLRRPLLGAHPRGCPSTRPRPARGFQRAEVDRENRLPVALHAPRPAALGGRL